MHLGPNARMAILTAEKIGHGQRPNTSIKAAAARADDRAWRRHVLAQALC